jgi:general secretion pathway protein I
MSPRSIGGQGVRGFTLIETVVALLVVALGMTAVYMQIAQFATNAFRMQEKTLASWIGSNVVTELSLQTDWPEFGDSEEEIEYAGRTWHVTIEISETEVENLRRADVAVALAERPERIIHTVSGLIEPPVPENFPPVNWVSVGRGPRG